jgi:hypothetical protein
MFRSKSAASAGLVTGRAGNRIAAERNTRSTEVDLARAGSDVGGSASGRFLRSQSFDEGKPRSIVKCVALRAEISEMGGVRGWRGSR